MADRVVPGAVDSADCIKEAVCVNTRKIMDSCRDKDCIEDLIVYPTVSSAAYIDAALSIRARSAELLYCDVSVREVSLNRGYYTVEATYYYRVTGETYPDKKTVSGLCIFDKCVMLFGSEGSVKTYSSDTAVPAVLGSDMPIATVDAVDPIILRMSTEELPEGGTAPELPTIPDFISAEFTEDLNAGSESRQLLVSLGQFTIVRLERNTQLLLPAYDYCVPDKECVGCDVDDPCTVFSKIRFPVDEFFPPDKQDCDDERGQRA